MEVEEPRTPVLSHSTKKYVSSLEEILQIALRIYAIGYWTDQPDAQYAHEYPEISAPDGEHAKCRNHLSRTVNYHRNGSGMHISGIPDSLTTITYVVIRQISLDLHEILQLWRIFLQ